ncbi:hypothetical protein EDC04DRAFT_2602344 [Pisolithus marmoratus]|nr:hypothetical protein EDC04DRAFT_2602344 [Pisolithus marmoratus]
MAESSYETSNHSSKEQLDPPPAGAKGTTLQDDEIHILQDNVQNWIAGDVAKRKTIFKNVGEAVLQLSPNKNLKKHHWEAKKKVGGYKPGTSTWISKYQWAVAKVMKSMSAEELDQAKETADTQNNMRAPAECRAAEAKGRQYAKQFAEEMWKQCGVQVVVMVAWSSADNDVLTTFHDYNDEIGDGRLFDNWGRMQDQWAQYAQSAFRQEADDPQNMDGESSQVPKVHKGQKWPEVELKMSMYGTPEIPTILNMTIQEKMDVGKHLGSQRQLFPGVCHELTTLLEWWQDRQVCKPWDVFQFKMWVQSDGSTHPPVASKDVGSNQAGSLQHPMRKNTKGKGKANDGHGDDEWEDIDTDVLSDSTDTDDLVDDGWISSDTTGSHSNGEGKMMEGMDSNPDHAHKSLKIGPPKGQKHCPIQNTQIDGAKSREKDETKSGSRYSKHTTAPVAHSKVKGRKISNFQTTDLSGTGTQHPHKKETPGSNDVTQSMGAIKPNFPRKEIPLPDISGANVGGVQQSDRHKQFPRL